MKKFLCFIIITCSLLSCNRYTSQSRKSCYKVYKIKTQNEHFEIYAKQGDRHYKIISAIEESNVGIKIKRGGCYNFRLKSNYETFKEAFGLEMTPNHRIETTYYTDNLKGLYFIGE